MNVKNVVKVMNFHALLRVDKARKDAEKFFMVEKELRHMIDVITNNRNFVLDKHMLKVNQDAVALNIYVGSDLGFCGGYNSAVNDHLRKDPNNDKIIIGKKIYPNVPGVILTITKDDFLLNHDEITNLVMEGIRAQKYSQINILYNHYVNVGQIVWKEKRIFPLNVSDDGEDVDYKEDYREDFMCESNVNDLLINLVVSYVSKEIEMTVRNSLASENIMRQNSTTDSLKKIDELEDEKKKQARKVKVQKTGEKITESFTRQQFINGD